MSPRKSSELRRLREARGLSLRDAAALIDCNHAALQRWETDGAEPTPEFRRAYAKMLGLTVGDLGALIYRESI